MLRKILVVDDVLANRLILRKMLQERYEVLEAVNGQDALSILSAQGESISAVLLDIIMPVLDGYKVLARMRSDEVMAQIPVIVATGSTEEGAEVKALSLGANDYISKPYNSEIIRHRLWNTINFHETAAIANAARRDELTGLYNRRAFFEHAAELIASHEAGYYVMACFDINRFKVINDQYGTEKGDAILRFIAKTFSDGFSKVGGICCRVMADNFAVLYPRSFMNTPEIAQIRQTAAAADGVIAPVTFSIGRYIVDDLSLSISSMYDRAALAESTIKGRYDVHIIQYTESMRDKLLREQELTGEMKAALENEHFQVWFQPQYNHATGALIGAEALVRWQHPRKGIISPGEFIPVFEKNGFIYELDKFVWEQTCRYLRSWLDQGRSPLPVSVNVSRYDIFRDDLIPVITRLLAQYRLSVELLRLEITESAFTESSEQIIQVVRRFIDLGFTVEIDDFGSGYSSLNTLKDVPAQVLKLDMRFLENNENSTRGGNILESVVRMAKWLGMSVIAEGVETREQADYLKSIGCDYMQGYFYAKPMPVRSYEQLARRVRKEEKMLVLETVQTLDNSAFWDPKSMDTLIFNSYVGGACIFEFHNNRIELLRANEKYAEMLSGNNTITVAEALQLSWMDHLEQKGRQTVYSALTEAIQTREEVTFEVTFQNLPGCPAQTYLRSSVRVIASTGDRWLVYCIAENITAQREAEQRAFGTYERMQAIMDNVPCGIAAVVLRQQGVRRLFANDRFYGLFGYTQRQYTDEIRDSFCPIHAQDREWVLQQFQAVNWTGEPADLDFRALRRDGSMVWLRASICLINFIGVEEPVLLGCFSDITAEKAAEQGR